MVRVIKTTLRYASLGLLVFLIGIFTGATLEDFDYGVKTSLVGWTFITFLASMLGLMVMQLVSIVFPAPPRTYRLQYGADNGMTISYYDDTFTARNNKEALAKAHERAGENSFTLNEVRIVKK